ncbi:hypothetical protein Tco_0047194 [Tanacetum coccineum]
MVLAYKSGLESVEEKLKVYKANKSIYSQDIKVLKFENECKDIAIIELRKKLEIAQKEKDGIQFNVDKFENASKSLNKLIKSQIVDNCKKGLGYNAVLPPYTRNFMPPTPDLKSNDYLIIEDWVSDSEEENVSQTKTEKKIVKPNISKIEFVKPKQQEKTTKKTVKQDKQSGYQSLCFDSNFDLEVMELENTQNNVLAKLLMLKLGEYEMWEIRIKQYFQIHDYALWEVIENGNSWVPIPCF